ncbi:MAG TPA: intradiol ring-cleavage dioxygenase, partial [bacterium]|nr:intradiol ring-cleavage dioxygenase [bacterium]
MTARVRTLVMLGMLILAPVQAQVDAAPACPPTRSDALGPFYTPGAPMRDQVGRGHVLTGVVKSSRDCRPLGGARIEFWLAGPSGEYGDAWRATVAADREGRYRFESHLPPPYAGRPSHIHVRVSAQGHRVLVTQY